MGSFRKEVVSLKYVKKARSHAKTYIFPIIALYFPPQYAYYACSLVNNNEKQIIKNIRILFLEVI